MINYDFWKGKRVLLTGHTGFKGSWLSLTLSELGAEVVGISNNVPTNPSLFESARVKDFCFKDYREDIRNYENILKIVNRYQPEILFHLAAQPLVRKSYVDPIETYSTNVMGTLNVLLSSQSSNKLKSIVCITTDKCYENKEWAWPYRETDVLGGYDPYSSSKACTEILSASIRNSFLRDKGINLATVRAGNVVGGGDWAEDRIIPDLARAYEKKNQLEIRNPLAIRPWQHVMEPVIGYILLAEQLFHDETFADAWNFGPNESDCISVEEITKAMLRDWNDHPGWVFTGDSKKLHEATILKLDCSKAKARLKWQPRKTLTESLKMTSEWYQDFFKGNDMNSVTLNQVRSFLLRKDL